MGLGCGVDVGGTKILGGVVDEDGAIVEKLRVESPATDVEAMEEAIAGLVRELAGRHDVTAVGVGAAGYVDRHRAKVLIAPNLAWRDIDLRAELEEQLDLRVVVENDANAAAWGEFRFGAGEDVDDLLLVTVGTGVGGGLVLDGAVHRGAFGVAAEVGHLRVVPDGLRCGCGRRGCLEQYASGSALERRARERADDEAAGPLLDRVGGDPTAIDGPVITELARAGDPFCVAQLAELGHWLGAGIASLVAVLDPAVIAVGGGVADADELFLDPVREAFTEHLPGREHRPVAEIRKASLGNTAGLIGAADLARR